MSEERQPLKMRAVLTTFPEQYEVPARPSGAPPQVKDAYRQTQFLLATDLALFERAMNVQLAIVAANAKRRSPLTVALLSLWSRVFAYLADACALLTIGSYVSCPPVLRAACDSIAAQRALLGEDGDEFLQWVAQPFRTDREKAALGLDLGRFRAGAVLAQEERLGAAYRLLTDLCMPHFGTTALLVAPDSGLQKLALTFGDSSFHLGWAELIAGWLLQLVRAQLEVALAGVEVVAVSEDQGEQIHRFCADIELALADPRRCRVEELEDGRRLIQNFRRAASGAPRKLLLG